jgi:serpin B
MADASRDGQTALALRLTKHLSPRDDNNDDDATGRGRNVAFSPLSIHAALALLAAGARGATRAQLLNFLGTPSAADLATFGSRLTDIVLTDQADIDGPRVLFGGGIWVSEHRGPLKETFMGVAANSYKSEARTVNFAEKVSD